VREDNMTMKSWAFDSGYAVPVYIRAETKEEAVKRFEQAIGVQLSKYDEVDEWEVQGGGPPRSVKVEEAPHIKYDTCPAVEALEERLRTPEAQKAAVLWKLATALRGSRNKMIHKLGEEADKVAIELAKSVDTNYSQYFTADHQFEVPTDEDLRKLIG
jgi:hypothetical protein